jgi:hypothetical protein
MLVYLHRAATWLVARLLLAVNQSRLPVAGYLCAYETVRVVVPAA